MTAWNPQPQIRIDGVTYTGFVDYNINFQRGQSGPYEAPQPGSGSVTLLFMDTPAVPVEIGSKIEIRLIDTGSTYQTANTGWVTDINLSAMAYGAAGSVWALSIAFVGLLAKLQNQTYDLTADLITTYSSTAIGTLIATANSTQWNQLNPASTWADIDAALTWNTFDDTQAVPYATYGGGGAVRIPAATGRDLWGDLVKLIQGSHTKVTETPDGYIYTYSDIPKGASTTIPAAALLTDVEASNTITTMRNRVTVTDYLDAVAAYDSDDVSVYNYGVQDGSLATFLSNPGDAATIAAYIVNGLSDATMAITRFSIELTNPAISDADRLNYWYYFSLVGQQWTLSGLPAALGAMAVYTLGFSMNLTKSGCLVTFDCCPESAFYSSITWNQVPRSYTWTSYGTAYPTQKWSDL